MDALAIEARRLHVYMTHDPHDDEFMPVLSYRVDQRIARLEEEIVALKALRDKYTA